LCFFRRRGVIESLIPRRGIDLHAAWIRISNAGQQAVDQLRGASHVRRIVASLPARHAII
jgi:hypothetical protein